MDTPYLHGTSPGEQERLSLMNRLMNELALRAVAPRPGERIVDFGSGLGQLARALGRAAGTRVVGIERSPEQIAEAARRAPPGEEDLLELRRGPVEAPPLSDAEWGSFDLAHARFVLEHVPDPQAVVRQMVRAVKPGGRIVLQDDDHEILRLFPEPPGFAALWTAYSRTYDRLGCDPWVGRRLPALLAAAGATPVRCDFLFFGGCAGEERFLPLVDNLAGLLDGARPLVVRDGLLPAHSFDAAMRALREWTGRPDASIWYAIFLAEGVRPSAAT